MGGGVAIGVGLTLASVVMHASILSISARLLGGHEPKLDSFQVITW